jgi:hypothetical protein
MSDMIKGSISDAYSVTLAVHPSNFWDANLLGGSVTSTC